MLGAVSGAGPTLDAIDGDAMFIEIFYRQQRRPISILALTENRQHSRNIDMPRASSGAFLAALTACQVIGNDGSDSFCPHVNPPCRS